MAPEFREWGDGGNDRRAHVIVDISYAGGYITCRCDAVLTGSTPDALAEAWVRHGGQVLRLWNVVERGAEVERSADQRQETARAAIVLLGRQCRCSIVSIERCPNYVPGDAEGSYDDDDENE